MKSVPGNSTAAGSFRIGKNSKDALQIETVGGFAAPDFRIAPNQVGVCFYGEQMSAFQHRKAFRIWQAR